MLAPKKTYLEAPRFLLELFVTVHGLCDIFKVLFHLEGETVVQARQVCEACNAQIKVQHVVLFPGKNLS